MSDPNKQRRTPSTTMSPAKKKFDPERMVEQPVQPVQPARAAPAEAEAPVEMASGVVARGRCVHIVVPGRKKVIGSVALPTQDPTGPKTFKEVTTSETRTAGPGSTVTIEKSELERTPGAWMDFAIRRHPRRANGAQRGTEMTCTK